MKLPLYTQAQLKHLPMIIVNDLLSTFIAILSNIVKAEKVNEGENIRLGSLFAWGAIVRRRKSLIVGGARSS